MRGRFERNVLPVVDSGKFMGLVNGRDFEFFDLNTLDIPISVWFLRKCWPVGFFADQHIYEDPCE